jgi:hypothetical protein
MSKGPYVYDPKEKTFVPRMDGPMWPATPQDPLVAVLSEDPSYARRRMVFRVVLVILAVAAVLLFSAALFKQVLFEAADYGSPGLHPGGSLLKP